MSLAERLAGQRKETRPCVIGRALLQVDDPADRRAFDDALAGDLTTEFLAGVLADELGRSVAPTSLDRHRKERCCCGPR